MNILLPYYSRSGNTERLALRLADALRRRGHQVTQEKIEVTQSRSKWRLVPPLLPTLLVLPLYLGSGRFRYWWLARYRQAEQDIRPLAHPDVSAFDCICLGGPKWLYISYPVARYLQQVRGLQDKPVVAFATFCGPPLQVFEMEMLFAPLRRRIEEKGGMLQAMLAISSHFHEFFFFHEMEYVFRLVSRLAFGRSLRSFTQDSDWGQEEIRRFCEQIEKIPPL